MADIIGYWNDFTKTLQSAMCCIRTEKMNWDINDFFRTGLEDYNKYLISCEKMLPDMDNILEIGSGIGRILYNICDKYKYVYGIDISEGMIKWANFINENYFKKDNIKFILVDLSGNIPFSDNSISFVFSIITFQHIPDKNTQLQYIKEIDRVLKPKGIAKLMIQNHDYNKSNTADAQVGVGLSKQDIEDNLVYSKITNIEPSNWYCQQERNSWYTLQKNG
jgi:ubiquinone/menaquinone biosynthesis C-methylase UbiE